MQSKFSPDQIAKIEQELDSSSLDENTISVVKGLIAGQVFILDLVTKLINASGHLRTGIIKELATILEIHPKRNSTDNPSPDSSFGDDEQSQSETDSETDPLESEGESTEKSSTEEEDTGSGSKKEGEGEDLSKKKRRKRSNDEYQPILSYIHFHKYLEPGDQCPACLQGRVYPFREKVIPILIGRSPLAYEEHRLQTLRCNACGEIFESSLPKEVPRIGHSMPSAQALLTLLHYKIGVPFASISPLQEMFNQNVSPSQLWDVIEHAARAIEPIYDELRRQAANSKLFYTDDTTARILSHYPMNKENREKKWRKKAPKDRVATYSSLIIGCTYDAHEIYLFYHGRKYAGENLGDLLVNRNEFQELPIQMKDASTMNIPADIEVIEAKCNAHALRKFKDLRHLYPKECAEVLRRYAKVNKNDQMLLKRQATDSERLAYHKEHSLPLMEEIKAYVKGLVNNRMVEPNSSLGAAIAYFCSHFEELVAFCHIEGAPFDNNKSERGLKMIIRLRKTSMFYKTERGAEVAGILQSVLYTAQETGINVLDYLQTVLENPEKARLSPGDFMPWTYRRDAKGFEEEEFLEAVQTTM